METTFFRNAKLAMQPGVPYPIIVPWQGFQDQRLVNNGMLAVEQRQATVTGKHSVFLADQRLLCEPYVHLKAKPV